MRATRRAKERRNFIFCRQKSNSIYLWRGVCVVLLDRLTGSNQGERGRSPALHAPPRPGVTDILPMPNSHFLLFSALNNGISLW